MITVGELLSRNIRANFIDNFDPPDMLAAVEDARNRNIRIIPDQANFPSEDAEVSGVMEKISKMLTDFGKWSWKTLKWLKFSFQEAWEWGVAKFEALWNFDWNASDAELKAAIENYNIQIASIWGGVFGQFAIGYLGSIVFGAGVGFLCPVIGGPMLAKAIVGEVSRELLPDLIANLAQAITATLNLAAAQIAIMSYMGWRLLIKQLPEESLKLLVGEKNGDWIKNVWGSPTAPTLSFASMQEERIEKMDGKALKAFVEEALEEGYETFIEGGSIVAQKLDEAIFMYESAVQQAQGPERSIVIQPDRNSDEEILILEDIPQSRLIETTQLLINQHRLLGNRDLGTVVATSFDEPTIARPLLRKLKIFFSSRPKPPWTDENGKPAKTVEVSIPDLKKGVTWSQIKKAAREYSWGPFRAVARFTNKRNLIVYGENRDIALAKLHDFLDLSTATVQTITVTEESEVPNKKRKIPTKIYPRKATFLYRKNSLDDEGNVVINNQYFSSDYDSFLLWPEDEPPNLPDFSET
jgi:hypothetical protein